MRVTVKAEFEIFADSKEDAEQLVRLWINSGRTHSLEQRLGALYCYDVKVRK